MLYHEFPLVSIIIPVFNGSNYMREAIDSALSQTYANKEIIVVNDGSTDNGATESIAKAYGNRIRYIQKENGGVSSALNAGIKAMKGEYFSWLSHDDLYLPEKVSSQIDILRKLEDKKTVILCGSKSINAKSEDISSIKLRKTAWRLFPENQRLSWEVALKSVIENGSFNGCALLIHKEVLEECGLFNEELRYSQDLLMWMRIFLNGYGLCRSPGIHVCGRIHSGQLTQTKRELFHEDSKTIGTLVIDELINKSTQNYNFVKSYALYNAKYDNQEVVRMCIQSGRINSKLGILDIVHIQAVAVYGMFRPMIRNVYFKVFRRI